MANVDRPFGLRLVGTLSGSGGIPTSKTCYVDDAGTNGIFVGDPVVMSGSSHDTGHPEVKIATVSTGFTGVVTGLVNVGEGGANDPNAAPAVPSQGYYKDNEDGFVSVCFDPYAVYEIQEDSTGSNIADTDIGLFCDLVYTAGNTTLGISQVELDSSNAGTGDNVRIIARVRAPDNDPDAGNGRFYVTINEHTFNSVQTEV